MSNSLIEQQRVYYYSGNSINDRSFIDFSITLNPDGTYSWYETPVSSFIGSGHYSINNNVLIMNDGVVGQYTRVHRFRMEGNRLFFIENESDNFPMVRLQDGAEFVLGVNPIERGQN